MKRAHVASIRAQAAADIVARRATGDRAPRIRLDLVRDLEAHMSIGNLKVPGVKDAHPCAILNFGAAADCMSARLGYCAVEQWCYAKKAETAYPQVLPYRRRQGVLTRKATPAELAAAVLCLHRRFRVDHLRASESADFRGQRDVDLLSGAARILREYGIGSYTYTANPKLDYTGAGDDAGVVINGSGFAPAGTAGNRFIAAPREAIPCGAVICPANCRGCDRCTLATGEDTYAILH